MILFVGFLSTCIAASIIWAGFIISFLSGGKITGAASMVVTLMGLFLPLVVIFMALAFVYVALELKKTQLIFKDWATVFRRDVLNDTNAVHDEIGKELQKAMKKDISPAVMNISTDEPIVKYQNMNLPDDVELHFKE